MIRKLILLATLAGTLTGLTGAAAVAATPAMADTTCTAQIGSECGAYGWPGWVGSNGYNTYVVDQSVDVQSGSTGSVNVTSPSDWSATADYTPCGGCVQTFTAVQQLMNNWTGTGWTGPGPYSDTPLNALKKLQVVYTESSPSSDAGNQYEFAPDLWTNYPRDIMMWADTSPGRCDNNGEGTSNIIGQANLDGQNWTVYSHGAGDEIIFVLDGSTSTDPMTTDTCAQQESGTLHVLAALRWVSAHGSVTGAPAWSKQFIGQFNTGWEITAADGTGTFNVSQLAYKVALK